MATNSGGPHTLKYGVTVNHVLAVEVVLPDGSVVELGSPTGDSPGYDLAGTVRRQRRNLWHLHASYRAADPQSGRLPHAARHLRDGRRRHSGDQPHHRRGHHPGGPRDDGSGNCRRGRGSLSFRLSARRRGRPLDRSRRPGGRGRRRGGKNRDDLPIVRSPRSPPRHDRKRTPALVEVPQAGLRRRSAA